MQYSSTLECLLSHLTRWKKISFFYKQTLECFSEIYAQSKIDQKRIMSLIKRDVKFIGNLKLASLKKTLLQTS